MRPSDQLAAFVGDALLAGRTRDEIRTVLEQAGWSESEISDAMAAWADSDFTPPVPRPRSHVSAREAFFYGLMFIALAMTAWNTVWLAFELIDILVTEQTVADTREGRSAIRWSISALIVFFPLFLVLNTRIQRAAREDPAKRRSSVRRWFGYITLFLSAIALLGDLIASIFALLEGDLTLRFLLKALTISVVAGAIFLYFRREMADDEETA